MLQEDAQNDDVICIRSVLLEPGLMVTGGSADRLNFIQQNSVEDFTRDGKCYSPVF